MTYPNSGMYQLHQPKLKYSKPDWVWKLRKAGNCAIVAVQDSRCFPEDEKRMELSPAEANAAITGGSLGVPPKIRLRWGIKTQSTIAALRL